MKRFDLRGYGANYATRLIEFMNTEVNKDENGIFLFEIGDFSTVQEAADIVKKNNWTLMNSIKFNEVDWTVVIKKTAAENKLEEKMEDVWKI